MAYYDSDHLEILATGAPAETTVYWNPNGPRLEFDISGSLVATIYITPPVGSTFYSGGKLECLGQVLEIDPSEDAPPEQDSLIQYYTADSAWHIATSPTMETALWIYSNGDVRVKKILEISPVIVRDAALPDDGFLGLLHITADGILTVSEVHEAMSSVYDGIVRDIAVNVALTCPSMAVAGSGKRGSSLASGLLTPSPGMTITAFKSIVTSGAMALPPISAYIMASRLTNSGAIGLNLGGMSARGFAFRSVPSSAALALTSLSTSGAGTRDIAAIGALSMPVVSTSVTPIRRGIASGSLSIGDVTISGVGRRVSSIEISINMPSFGNPDSIYLERVATAELDGTAVYWNPTLLRYEFYIRYQLVAVIYASDPVGGEYKSNGPLAIIGHVREIPRSETALYIQNDLIEFCVSSDAWQIATLPNMETAIWIDSDGDVRLQGIVEISPVVTRAVSLPETGFGQKLHVTREGVLTVSDVVESLGVIVGGIGNKGTAFKTSSASGELVLPTIESGARALNPDTASYLLLRVVGIERSHLSPYQTLITEPLERPFDR